jgi:ferritin
MSKFTDALNGQVANEFGASQQYVAIAAWYDAETLPSSPPTSTGRPWRSGTTR